jgi:hypothetical protein
MSEARRPPQKCIDENKSVLMRLDNLGGGAQPRAALCALQNSLVTRLISG